MKKIIMSSLIGLFMIVMPVQLIKAEEEVCDDTIEIVSRSAIIKKWFSGQPPETYKGKSLINYYRHNKGYMGVYK